MPCGHGSLVSVFCFGRLRGARQACAHAVCGWKSKKSRLHSFCTLRARGLSLCLLFWPPARRAARRGLLWGFAPFQAPLASPPKPPLFYPDQQTRFFGGGYARISPTCRLRFFITPPPATPHATPDKLQPHNPIDYDNQPYCAGYIGIAQRLFSQSWLFKRLASCTSLTTRKPPILIQHECEG